jgi:hypothetical protein
MLVRDKHPSLLARETITKKKSFMASTLSKKKCPGQAFKAAFKRDHTFGARATIVNIFTSVNFTVLPC